MNFEKSVAVEISNTAQVDNTISVEYSNPAHVQYLSTFTEIFRSNPLPCTHGCCPLSPNRFLEWSTKPSCGLLFLRERVLHAPAPRDSCIVLRYGGDGEPLPLGVYIDCSCSSNSGSDSGEETEFSGNGRILEAPSQVNVLLLRHEGTICRTTLSIASLKDPVSVLSGALRGSKGCCFDVTRSSAPPSAVVCTVHCPGFADLLPNRSSEQLRDKLAGLRFLSSRALLVACLPADTVRITLSADGPGLAATVIPDLQRDPVTSTVGSGSVFWGMTSILNTILLGGAAAGAAGEAGGLDPRCEELAAVAGIPCAGSDIVCSLKRNGSLRVHTLLRDTDFVSGIGGRVHGSNRNSKQESRGTTDAEPGVEPEPESIHRCAEVDALQDLVGLSAKSAHVDNAHLAVHLSAGGGEREQPQLHPHPQVLLLCVALRLSSASPAVDGAWHVGFYTLSVNASRSQLPSHPAVELARGGTAVALFPPPGAGSGCAVTHLGSNGADQLLVNWRTQDHNQDIGNEEEDEVGGSCPAELLCTYGTAADQQTERRRVAQGSTRGKRRASSPSPGPAAAGKRPRRLSGGAPWEEAPVPAPATEEEEEYLVVAEVGPGGARGVLPLRCCSVARACLAALETLHAPLLEPHRSRSCSGDGDSDGALVSAWVQLYHDAVAAHSSLALGVGAAAGLERVRVRVRRRELGAAPLEAEGLAALDGLEEEDAAGVTIASCFQAVHVTDLDTEPTTVENSLFGDEPVDTGHGATPARTGRLPSGSGGGSGGGGLSVEVALHLQRRLTRLLLSQLMQSLLLPGRFAECSRGSSLVSEVCSSDVPLQYRPPSSDAGHSADGVLECLLLSAGGINCAALARELLQKLTNHQRDAFTTSASASVSAPGPPSAGHPRTPGV